MKRSDDSGRYSEIEKKNRTIEKKIKQRSFPEKMNTKWKTLTRQWDAHKIRDD